MAAYFSLILLSCVGSSRMFDVHESTENPRIEPQFQATLTL